MNRLTLFFALCASALIWPIPVCAQSNQQLRNWCEGTGTPTPEQVIKGCTALINSGRWEGNNLASLRFNRATGYVRMGDEDKAFADYEAAVQINPQNYAARYEHAQILKKRKQCDAAILDLDAAIAVSAKYVQAYFARGGCYEEKGDSQRAVQDYTTAIGVDPKYVPLYWERAYSLISLKRYDEAISDLTYAISQMPASRYSAEVRSTPFYNRALAYSGKGDYTNAIQDLTAAIALVPDPKLFRTRTVQYMNALQYDLALKDAETYAQMLPKDAIGWHYKCWNEAIIGQLQQAVADCDKSLELGPNMPDTLGSRGLAYLKLAQYDKSIADYSLALKIRGYVEGGATSATIARFLYGRGLARLRSGDALGGSADMAAAKDVAPGIVDAFKRAGA